ncbi:MAG: 2-oxoglutarate dehydrogenase complex dihydrolipoyllysine-residue succinyltransferase [Cyclobacteriaceae bacterium]
MSLEIKVPTVGESITEVTIASWTKKEGDFVEMDEVIAELESDKATFELNAEQAGVLHIIASEGDTVEVGAVICEIDTEASGQGESKAPQKEEASSSAKEAAPAQPADKSAPPNGEVVEMKIPTVGESITEVTIAEWLKKDGEYVEMDEVIAEIESDKATFELTAEAAGILRIKAEAGETLEIGTLACTIEAAEQDSQAQTPAKEQPEAQGTRSTESDRETAPIGGNGRETYATGHAAPAAAKILSEKGIDPKDVKGTGRDGRITKEDAEKAQKQAPAARQAPAPSAQPSKEAPKAQPTPQTVGEGDRRQRREKMTNLRKTISRRLVAAKNETAMLTTFNEVDMKPVMDLRKKYKDAFKEKYEVNLGFMSFFTKAACMALKEWPAVNAMIDGEEIVYNEYCDVSIAVSSPRGLVVPVIRNAENMSFDQIEKEVVRLAIKAREGKLSIEEMTGGTFTITNGGIFGSMLSTPIINQPQSAILGMHNIVERPVAINGQVEIRPIMYVALSYDHRIIDGRESVSFLYRLKELLEDPSRLLLGI